MDPSQARRAKHVEAEEPTDRATVSFSSEVFEFSAGVPGKHSALLFSLLMVAAVVAAPPLVIWSSGVVLSGGLVSIIITLQLIALLISQVARSRKT